MYVPTLEKHINLIHHISIEKLKYHIIFYRWQLEKIQQSIIKREREYFLSVCLSVFLSVFLSFFFFLSFLLRPHPKHMEVPRLGIESDCSCWPTPQPQQRQIRATSATHTTAHGDAHSNARSLTHWAGPGIETASSWILVRFVSLRQDRNPKRENIFLKKQMHPMQNQNEQDIYWTIPLT